MPIIGNSIGADIAPAAAQIGNSLGRVMLAIPQMRQQRQQQQFQNDIALQQLGMQHAAAVRADQAAKSQGLLDTAKADQTRAEMAAATEVARRRNLMGVALEFGEPLAALHQGANIPDANLQQIMQALNLGSAIQNVNYTDPNVAYGVAGGNPAQLPENQRYTIDTNKVLADQSGAPLGMGAVLAGPGERVFAPQQFSGGVAGGPLSLMAEGAPKPADTRVYDDVFAKLAGVGLNEDESLNVSQKLDQFGQLTRQRELTKNAKRPTTEAQMKALNKGDVYINPADGQLYIKN